MQLAILGQLDVSPPLAADQEALAQLQPVLLATPDELSAAGGADVILIGGSSACALLQQARQLCPDAGLVVLLPGAEALRRIECLEQGADVCVTGPGTQAELAAIVRNLRRRLAVANSQRAGSWKLSGTHPQLFTPAGEPVRLTPSELLLMRQLVAAFPDIVTRRQIAESMGQDYLSFDERRIEALVSRLRHKLPHPSPLRHARGRGYFFSAPIEMVSAA
jgi:DNA-binding response OmpR family regulator